VEVSRAISGVTVTDVRLQGSAVKVTFWTVLLAVGHRAQHDGSKQALQREEQKIEKNCVLVKANQSAVTTHNKTAASTTLEKTSKLENYKNNGNI
jgi:hypothetical protein